MEKQAQLNELPPHLFVRLIWRESRFRPRAVSHKGAQGIAQFMPATARERGLADPFDPEAAIIHSARLLADLKRDLGNFGLAAAAYNAGADRIRGWVAGTRRLPAETAAYVRFITGRPAEDWKAAGTTAPPAIAFKGASLQESCRKLAPNIVHAMHAPAMIAAKASWRPWGAELGAGFTRSAVEEIYADVKKRHAALLSGARPMYVSARNLSRGRRALITLRVGADTREGAQALCLRLRAAGAPCVVRKN